MDFAGVLRAASAVALSCIASMALAQGAPSLAGTYSNLSPGAGAGDLNGYELTLLPQAGGTYAVLQCAQGAPSTPVLAPVHRMGDTISFEIQQPNHACNGVYSATLHEDGLDLRGPDGQSQTLPQRPSYWISHTGRVAPTPLESANEPYFRALNASCPDRNLQHLPPAQLSFQIEKFEPRLTPEQHKSVDRATTQRCDGAIVGSGCGNVGFLEAAQRDGFLPKFVQFVCGQPVKCSGPGACSGQ
ncbi:hypothetical protein SAMN05421770_10145 [Granulicella rosea]|uniref:Uncharacterized protein n=1 Tax=Granulicella rosea TaxID=474952 RepID=A0A239CR66_9BACT|nr:hypothetical protein [Granulicella rosea]SNS22141.1 hypothetical protein SAMN05421770_10145 [Granulicella rosea]